MSDSRRLSDKIVSAHQHACEQGKVDVARHLLHALESELSGFGGNDADEQRDFDDAIAAAYTRQRTVEAKAG